VLQLEVVSVISE